MLKTEPSNVSSVKILKKNLGFALFELLLSIHLVRIVCMIFVDFAVQNPFNKEEHLRP